VVKFECGSCGFKKAVDDKYAGKNVRCPKCSNPVTVSTQQIQTPTEPANLIKIYCPLCNKKIAVPAQYAGKRVKCPNCKNPLMVEPPHLTQFLP
jgi:SulP family sulfate permease